MRRYSTMEGYGFVAQPSDAAFDPNDEVRTLLTRVVAERGPAILATRDRLDLAISDYVADLPRELELVLRAAERNVPALLHQASDAGPDAAVRIAASNFAQQCSLDPVASTWVVATFARALHYAVSDDIEPPPRVDFGTAQPAPPASGRAPGSEDVTVTPAAPAAPAVPAVPAVPAAPAAPAGGTHAVGLRLTSPVHAGVGGPSGALPGQAASPAAPAQPPVPGPYAPYVARPRSSQRSALITVGTVVVVLGAYFGIASAAHLPPFKKAASTHGTHGSQTTRTGHHVHGTKGGGHTTVTTGRTTTPTPTTTPNTYQTLDGLIPSNVKSSFSCQDVAKPVTPEATAEIKCTSTANISPDSISYYLFPSESNLSDAYQVNLGDDGISMTSGTCPFTSFKPPCEGRWTISGTPEGRFLEYDYNGEPNLITTVTTPLLIVQMNGSTANVMLTWWKCDSNWMAGGATCS